MNWILELMLDQSDPLLMDVPLSILSESGPCDYGRHVELRSNQLMFDELDRL